MPPRKVIAPLDNYAYFEVNPLTLWDILTIHLEPLRRSVRQLRSQVENDKGPSP